MIVKIIKVSDKGQVSIPKEIREKANIESGDELLIALKNEKILIEKVDNFGNKLWKNFSKIFDLNNNK